MNVLRKFLENHVLANLTFALVIILGALSFMDMPRARDPDINFNWINIQTALPGASSIEVEKRITDPIEDALARTLKDMRFVQSTSRESISSILVRFNQLSDEEFDKRVADLRREVQSVANNRLPDEATDPYVIEITSSSGFPTAILALEAPSFDDGFRRYAELVKKEIERIKGVDNSALTGVEDPELHIAFYPERLVGLGITPADLADTVRAYFNDTSVGDLESANGKWVVRLEGTAGTLEDLAAFPITGASGVVPLGDLADIYRSWGEAGTLSRFKGRPAVMISVTKQEGVNILEILENLNTYIEEQNAVYADKGYRMHLVDDQTISTREAVDLMQSNALIGLMLVVVVAFLFLGGHISFLTSIGIPFTLAGTFIVLNAMGMSVNNTVLLGVVIALGMLVDDAVVVVEAVYYRLQRGQEAMDAGIDALKEVAAPVFTSVLTTIAVFLPLMLLPGILGEFMRVIPIVVCVGLAISLVEAFWMLPAHISFIRVDFSSENRLQRLRRQATRQIRHRYSFMLTSALRHPWITLLSVLAILFFAVGLLTQGVVKKNFFAADPMRVFYVNIEMPKGTDLRTTLALTQEVEIKALEVINPEELRNSLIYSGYSLTQTEPVYGDHLGQVFLSLSPAGDGVRDVLDIVDAVKQHVGAKVGDAEITVLEVEDGPPVGQPISVKVRGQDFDQIIAATEALKSYMVESGVFENINVDFKAGSPEMRLSLNGEAIQRAGLHPVTVTRSLQSFVDGELLNQYQYLGEEVDVRLLAKEPIHDTEQLLQQTIANRQGDAVPLGQVLDHEYAYGYENIRHYNFQRAVTISADILDEEFDTVQANGLIDDAWQKMNSDHPGISLDFSGVLDDIQESLNGMAALFLMGVGLIYLILGTQFKSYFKPFLVIVSVPLAFCGVVFGLVITGNPMSLYTMYGVVALSGISVNAAIVLISAANERVNAGMGVMHATVFAARRRVIPILITSFTTIAGLFSLAAGFAGDSLIWGPVATAIISGLIFSTVLVLIVVPLLYRALAGKSRVVGAAIVAAVSQN